MRLIVPEPSSPVLIFSAEKELVQVQRLDVSVSECRVEFLGVPLVGKISSIRNSRHLEFSRGAYPVQSKGGFFSPGNLAALSLKAIILLGLRKARIAALR